MYHFLSLLSPPLPSYIDTARTSQTNLSLVRLFASQRTNKEEIDALTMWILTTWHRHLNNGCVILQAGTNITALLSARKVSYMSYAYLSFLHCLVFLLWPSLRRNFCNMRTSPQLGNDVIGWFAHEIKWCGENKGSCEAKPALVPYDEFKVKTWTGAADKVQTCMVPSLISRERDAAWKCMATL